MTHEQVVWWWLRLTEHERAAAVRKMLDDGRVSLGKKLEFVPVGRDYERRQWDIELVP